MPKNPFVQGSGDPLAPSAPGGAWGAGAGQGAGGFGASNTDAVDIEGEEYSVVEIDPSGGGAAKFGKPGNGAANGNTKNAAARQKDLDRREAELLQREQAVKRQEEQLRQAGRLPANALMVKNWPPCMPIVHHDIAADIPADKRNIMRMGTLIYLVTATALIWNFIAVTTAWIVGASGGQAGWAFFIAAMYAVIGIPLGWLLWYKRLYRAMMFDGAITFATFFCVFMVHIGFAVWSAVAPPINNRDLSHAGIMTALKLLDDDNEIAFIFYIVGFGLWTATALLSFSYLLRVYAVFRGNGGVQKARREAVRAGVEMVESDIAAGNRY